MSTAKALPILIADDDEAYVQLVREILADVKGERFAVHHVTYLSRIVPALQSSGACVLLLDVNLPDGNGLDWLSANRDRFDAAVIVMTGHTEFDLAEDIAPGAQDFLLKNQLDRHQLVRAIRYAAERQRTQRELVRSREYFQSLIDASRDLITVVDSRGIILYQSPSSLETLGLAPHDVINHSLGEFIQAEDVPRARMLLSSAFAGRSDGSAGEFNVSHANGTARILDVAASKLPSVDGQRRAVLYSRDITERRQAQEALRLRDQQLRQAQKMEAVGRLAGGIAHDFSNVLTVITAASERLQDRVIGMPEALADIDSILRNAERAASLTRQLLAFSRQQTLAPQPLDLGQLVRRAARLLKRLIGEHIVLDLEITPDDVVVEADPTQIEQVLMNLAINARDAMPGGGSLQICVERRTADEAFTSEHQPMLPGEYVLLEVIDTGGGMTPETAARAFEPFFSTKHPSQGTGLGLSTVYGIVKQSGGYIWIDTAQGRGSTFSIYLPATSETARAPEHRTRSSPAATRPVTILLAEDEDEVRELLRDLLESQGHTVLEANGPAQGVDVASSFPGRIDLLLTDVVMPGGTGRDLARKVEAMRPEVKVLYMSGYPDVGGSPQSVLEPGLPFLAKPFTRDTLLAKLHEVLGHSRIHHP